MLTCCCLIADFNVVGLRWLFDWIIWIFAVGIVFFIKFLVLLAVLCILCDAVL